MPPWYVLVKIWLGLNALVFLAIWSLDCRLSPVKRRKPSKPSAPSSAGGRTPGRGKTSRPGSSGRK